MSRDGARGDLALAARILAEAGLALVLASVLGVACAGWLAPESAAGLLFRDAYALDLPEGWGAARGDRLVAELARRFPSTRPTLQDEGLAFSAPREVGRGEAGRGEVAAGDVFAWLAERDVPTARFEIGPGWMRVLEVIAARPEDVLASVPFLMGLLAPAGVAFLLVGWRWRRRLQLAALDDGPRGPAVVVRGLLCGLAILAAALLLERALARLGWVVQEQALYADLVARGGAARAAFLVVAVGLGPLGEEVLFRGALFAALQARGRVVSAYAISTAAFAGLHMNPSALPLYVLYGLGLGLTYRGTRRLAAPVVAHVTVNAGAVALALLQSG